MSIKVGFVGMTHLGLNSAVAGAERGFDMVCFDPDTTLISELNAGTPPVQEPELTELMAKHKARIHFTADTADLNACDVVYVAPDVATDDQGNSDLTTLEARLATAFESTGHDTAIVVLSQVPPGFSRTRQQAGRTLIYQVETLIFGRVIERAMHPERYIIGLENADTPLPPAYKTYLDGHGNPPLFPMAYESAELAKIAINCCLVSSVSTANMLAELCEKMGANWADIIPTLKADKRIGQYSYLAPGLGISGGNLERDLNTIIRMADLHGTDSGVVRSWVHNSQYRKDWPLRMLATYVFPYINQPTIGVLGLTYKENTHSIKNSPSVQLIKQLGDYRLQAFDPMISAEQEWHASIDNKTSAKETCKGADVLLLLTAWPEFRELDPTEIAEWMQGDTIIDPFQLLDHKQVKQAGLQHIILGTQPHLTHDVDATNSQAA